MNTSRWINKEYVMPLMLAFAMVVLLLTAPTAHAQSPAIPDLAAWESQMLSFGSKHCSNLQNPSVDGNVKLNETYYDSERVFYQIYDYTKDPKWLACAQAAEQVYRNGYVLANNGSVPAYWIFGHGIWYDWKTTGDSQSQTALLQLANSGGFAYAPLSWTAGTDSSREVAYNIQTKLLAMDVGYADQNRYAELLAQAYDHMNQWFVAKSAPYIRPFMVALTSEALIHHFRKTGDPNVLPTVQMAMEYLWNCCWLGGSGAFMYTDRVAPDGSGDQGPAPDLNLLIAPAFGWLYMMTGDAKWQQRGDQIFSAGVRVGPSFIYLGKQYNQNYRWSFHYVAWRQGTLPQMYALVGTATQPIGVPSGSLNSGGGGGGGGSSPSLYTDPTSGQMKPRNYRK